jgi:hypothetical protein
LRGDKFEVREEWVLRDFQAIPLGSRREALKSKWGVYFIVESLII